MKSLWQAKALDIPTDPPQPGAHHDVIVVGAGLSGLTTALLLARAGLAVTVLEARTVGAVATGNTTGKLSLLQGSVLSQIRQHCGDDALVAYVQANHAGQEWLLAELAGTDAEPIPYTAYTYANGDDGFSLLEAELAASKAGGLPARWSAQVPLPFAVAGGLELPQQYALEPMATLAILATRARELGVRIVERCRVMDVYQDGQDLVVATGPAEPATTWHTSFVVLATGTPIVDRSLFFAKLTPMRSVAAAYEVAENQIPAGMFLAVDKPHRSLRPARDAAGKPVLIAGGDGHITGRTSSVLAAYTDLDAWVQSQFPGAKRRYAWAAQDYRTHSWLPFAGPIHGADGRVFAATGYNKWGMTNGVAAALAITGQICDQPLGWSEVLLGQTPGLRTATTAALATASAAQKVAAGWVKAELSPPQDPHQVLEGQGEIIREGLAPVATARIDGRLCRVSGICTHMGGILNWNDAEQSWDCPLHGSRFDLDGQVLEGPAVEPLQRWQD